MLITTWIFEIFGSNKKLTTHAEVRQLFIMHSTSLKQSPNCVGACARHIYDNSSN